MRASDPFFIAFVFIAGIGAGAALMAMLAILRAEKPRRQPKPRAQRDHVVIGQTGFGSL